MGISAKEVSFKTFLSMKLCNFIWHKMKWMT